MDIQLAGSGINSNYKPSLNNIGNTDSEPICTSVTLPNSYDTIEISMETTALSNALPSVEKALNTSFNRGYPIPPMCLTNDKQIDIIKKMIADKLSTPVDDTAVSKAAESLWKSAGYRLDTTPAPNNTNGSGNASNFLTKSDRQELDKIYNRAEANGLDAIRISYDSAFEIAKKRMKEVDIANGCVFGNESDIIPLSKEEWNKLNEADKLTAQKNQIQLVADKELANTPGLNKNSSFKDIMLKWFHFLKG